MLKRTKFDSSLVNQRADELLNAASSRYKLTVQVANRAKRRRYEDFDNPDDPMMKPVIRAIIEMSDELNQPEILGDEADSIGINSNFVERSLLKPIKPSISQQKPVDSVPLPTHPTASPALSPSQQKPVDSVPLPTHPIASSALSPEQIQVAEINASVSANPQLQQLKQESNLQAWKQLINWLSEGVCKIDFASAKDSVKRLKYSYHNKSPREIARVLIVHKSLQAAGVDLIRGIPKAEAVIAGLTGYELPEIMKLSAEMVYQIAAIYGFGLDDPARKIEALTAFGAAFLGEQAIDAGIDWLQYDCVVSKIISASAKALMIFAVGNAACLFYEAKLNPKINPLSSSVVLNKIRQDSQQYLSKATSEDAIIGLISDEIDTALTIDYTQLSNLLKAREWKKADQETRDIIVKLANRDPKSSLKCLPSVDLQAINNLWVDNSKGYFGFRIQQEIYFSLSKEVGCFGETVGWRGEAGMLNGIFAWKSYRWLTFNSDTAPKGHLPAFWLAMPWWYHKGTVTRDFAESILERNDW